MFPTQVSREQGRREFLKGAAIASAAAMASTSWAGDRAAPASEPKAESGAKDDREFPPLVDTHQHLWDLSKFRLPWLKEVESLAKSHVMSDYLEATAGLNIKRSVYMEVDVAEDQQGDEIAYISELCEKKEGPLVAAVVSGRPASDEFPKYLQRHRDNPYVRGIRQVLHVDSTPPGFCVSRQFIRGIRKLGEIGWSFDLCMRSSDLADASRLVDACPDTRFVLDHCGNPSVIEPNLDPWKKDLSKLAERDNVIAKISGIIASGAGGKWSVENMAPIVNHVIDSFGPDRIVFGGDWPVCTLAATFREWVVALGEIVADRPAETRQKLFHDNAVKFYRLPEVGA